MLQSAAPTDPALATLAEQAMSQRRYGCRYGCGLVAESVARKARLRNGLTTRAAGDVIYALASPDSYLLLTKNCGWSPRRYQRWLAEALVRELLA